MRHYRGGSLKIDKWEFGPLRDVPPSRSPTGNLPSSFTPSPRRAKDRNDGVLRLGLKLTITPSPKISKRHKPKGPKLLQMKLLSQILKQQSLNVVSSNEGAQKMSSALRCKKVSIVLDDVDNDNQLEYLVGGRGWFGDESRIITTTSRNIDLLQKHDEIYRVPELSIDEALELFQLARLSERDS
ncbi:hypothetical protein BC332_16131 [Capsicum chinense]|nr:hypothetical protein BC332_16131 [Capsicum chinense]